MKAIDADKLLRLINEKLKAGAPYRYGVTIDDVKDIIIDYAEYDNEDEKAHSIIRYYGAKHQLLKLAEECAELTQQCMKCFDLDLQYSEDFIEELADVKVMLMQFESILSPAFAEMYERIITEKLDRQLKRMEVQSG